ncbi:MAG TPA: exonuclease SbcCD subunit D [Pseudogracilibacillus sp.]|nr:exonuclease SbcCD subunit D [Pseudogracilibacillus sp.]
MKIFHTADWHLGKVVHGASMLEEQRYILQQFTQIIEEEKPDVIIIAGDLYDRVNPPAEAVHLLNDFLDEIVLSLEIPVIAIAGNHDSPIRVHFGSKLMREKGFHIAGLIEEEVESVVLHDEFGEVHFHLLPFVDPSVVANTFNDDSIRTYDDAMRVMVERIDAKKDPDARHVLVSHYFVTPQGEEKENTSDSERVLSIGGIEYVNAEHLKHFDYVALGHLHRAHSVQEPHIRYAGSPLKYSISEEGHQKAFTVVDLQADGELEIDKRLFTPRRDMRTVEGTIEEILAMDPSDDYIFIELLNKTPVLSPMEKIRTVFPNVLHLNRPFDQMIVTEDKMERVQKKQQTDLELFTAFYEEVKGFAPEEAAVNIFKEVVEDLLQTDID